MGEVQNWLLFYAGCNDKYEIAKHIGESLNLYKELAKEDEDKQDTIIDLCLEALGLWLLNGYWMVK